jgi:hypothetical protein
MLRFHHTAWQKTTLQLGALQCGQSLIHSTGVARHGRDSDPFGNQLELI